VTLETFRRIDVLFERNGMLFGECRHRPDNEHHNKQLEEGGRAWPILNLLLIRLPTDDIRTIGTRCMCTILTLLISKAPQNLD
jgi:hypothetical protein